MSNTLDRTLPHNLEAERSVLGAILLHNDAMNDAADVIDASHFFRDAHRRIYEHMCRLVVQSAEIDLVTLKESLTKTGELDECGGPAYIAALIDGVPRSTNIEHYARIVRDKSDLRQVIFAANKMCSRAYEAEDDARDVVEEAERVIFQVAEGSTREGFVPVSSLLQGVMERLERICATKQAITGVPTGFTDLDEMTRGLQPGNLVIVAGRPSMGKTALAVNIAEHVSMKAGLSVGVFSIEQSAEELVMRSLASGARIDGHRMQSGFLGERDWGRLGMAMGALGEAKLHIDQTPNIGVFEMRARARRLKAERGLDLVIVDYLQLMASHEKKVENRTIELGAITRALKTTLARDLNVPVIVLSQLSRAPELRSEHRPMLSDLRESGSIEQDADVVMFVYRDEYYHPDRDDNKGIAELIVAKQRNGPIGTVKLCFIREFTRFENLAQSEQYEDRRLPMGDR